MTTPRKSRTARILVATALLCAGLGLAHAEGVFKNLQILPKDTDKPTLKGIMKKQARALGVECDFCHDPPDMAKDTGKKKIGREMMTLVGEINKSTLKPESKATGSKSLRKAVAYYTKHIAGKTPDKDVTCETCHKGHEEPPK